MEIPESTQPASRETCLGLPFVEERPISEEERVALQREARQSIWHGLGWGCLLPILFLGMIMALASAAMDSNSTPVEH